MHIRSHRTSLALAVVAVAACADATRNPVSPAERSPDKPRTTTSTASDVWKIEDLDALLGAGMYSLDTTEVGNSSRLYIDSDYATTESLTFCRDHFKPIDLWWDGGYGIARFHLDPPLLFVGYRPGTYRTGVLTLRRAVYETLQPSEGIDPAGNVWRFQGRFNALCAFGELELGPIVARAQIVRSQDPLNRPVLVRRGNTGGEDGCGGGAGGAGGDGPQSIEETDYNPYDPMMSMDDSEGGGGCGSGSGTQYAPGDSTGGETVEWETGIGNGGASACGDLAVVEYICIDVWVDGVGWVEWSCGYATTC